MAATHSAVNNSSITSNAVSVPASSANKTLGSNSSTDAQVSTHIDFSVTATIAIPDSNNTISVVNTLSATSTGTTSIHQSVKSTSIVAPQPFGTITTSLAATMAPPTSDSTNTPSSRSQAAPSATNTTQPLATAKTTSMASYTSQSSALEATSQSAVPSMETSSTISPGLLASNPGNVTGSASPQPASITVPSSNGMLEQSQKGSVISTSSVPKASSKAAVLGASSFLNPTLCLYSVTSTVPP